MFIKTSAIATATLALLGASAEAARLPQQHLASGLDPDGNSYLNAGLPDYVFHQAGQYSPRYTVPSLIPDVVPVGCEVTLVNSLERHGARYQTSGATKQSTQTLQTIQKALQAPGVDIKKLSLELQFLVDSTHLNETADLNPYGALQAYYSGKFTRDHYEKLAKSSAAPFIRTTGDPELGDDRVVLTAQYWALGYLGESFSKEQLLNGTQVRASDAIKSHQPNVIISEQDGKNNTLDVSTCPADEAYGKSFGENGAVKKYGQSTLEPVIAKRLEQAFAKAGANISLTYTDIQSLDNLCTFETLGTASVTGGRLGIHVSPYCKVFKAEEFELIGYALDAGKYYGSGYGDPFHRSQANGYLRELLSRLTSTAPIVSPPTSENATLDTSASTFPVPSNSTPFPASEPRIFFDGSHDNNISPIVSAFGLFNSAQNLSLEANAESTPQGRNRKWRFSQIAPLQGKIVWEKLQCGADKRQFVRVRANEAIQKAQGEPWCPSDPQRLVDLPLLALGLCPLDNVVQGLDWVKDGDEWAKCYK